jgi:hypothetical protein
MLSRFLQAFLLALVSCGLAWADSIQVVPASPRYFETVYLRATLPVGDPHYIGSARVSMQGTTITVDYLGGIDIPGRTAESLTVMLGKFPAGNYAVQANLPNGPVTTQFTVGAKPDDQSPFIDFTGLWWNPAEPGWGLSITQGPTSEIFAAWFVYDAAGNPTWYTLEPGYWDGPDVYHGTIYRTTGPTGPFFQQAFDPSRVNQVAVGTGTLEFFKPDFTSGSIVYTIDGQQGFKHIERMAVE